MKITAALHRRLHWLNLPGTLLIALLQRTPAVSVVASATNTALVSPVSAVLKAAAATLGALGAVHSMAGATTLSYSPNVSPGVATVGAAKTFLFTVTGAETPPASFTVGGSVPPGMSFSPVNSATAGITVGVVNASTLQLTGTPTAAGQFVIKLQAWEGPNATLISSSIFSYTINVAAATNSAPTITAQPTGTTVSAGGTVVLSAAAAGSPTPTFQWFKNSVALSGQTASTLVVSGASPADAGNYTLVATNSLGSATSNIATVTVTGSTSLPVILSSPASATVAAGGSAVLVVSATNSPAYQWRKNGVAISGATSATLSLTGLTTSATAVYDVVATTLAGSATSAGAALIVTGPLTARLSNLSVRTTLAANQLLTVGLTMSGGGKDVLLRAAGPGLGALGVAGTMADPKLALFNGPTQIAANDNWGSTTANATAVGAAIAAVGAFPFPSTASLDAALVATVDGGRTAQVSGPSAGNVIVEAYDTTTSNSPRLTNLSALNFVGTGGDVLIAGFTVAGTGTKNLLIRAAGPSLAVAPFNIGGTLLDPKLTVRDSNQVIVGENDNYAPALATVFSSVGAFGFVAGAKDAAVLISVPASSNGAGYTVTVAGADGGTGLAIIEVYELP